MAKNKQFSNVFLESIIQKIFYWFPFLKQIKIFDEKVTSSESTFDSLMFESIESYTESGTEVSIEGCNITISLKIEIYGEGATDELANDMEVEIIWVWATDKESNNWYIDCKEKDKTCPRLKPGCKVEFNVEILSPL